MFKEHLPAGRGRNTKKASEVLTLTRRGVAMTEGPRVDNYALKWTGVWEIFTAFLPN